MLLLDLKHRASFWPWMRRAIGSARGKGSKTMTIEAIRMRDGPPVTDLVARAMGGDTQAWDALVELYIPLVWSICRGHRLDHTDARTVSQTVWRQLAGQLGTLRDPAVLADWLAITTRRECDQVLHAVHQQPGPGQTPEATKKPGDQTAERELQAAELHAALREAFAQLPPRCQRLIAMLIQDPPLSDAQISADLGIPAHSIRHNCHGCLQKLRRYPAIATLINAETKSR
jgi:RNA polymerase sigma factor (sigma-70 family)